MRPWLVGLAPGTREGVGKPAFSVGGSSRRRLEELVGDPRIEDHFRVVNLVQRYLGEGSKILTQAELTRCAEELLGAHRLEGGILVCLGRTVQRALFPASFSQRGSEAMADYELCHRTTRDGYGAWVLPLPHPSGLCREWNDPESVLAGQRAIRSVMQIVPRYEYDC